MLKIPKTVEYAFLAMKYIADYQQYRLISAKEIAEDTYIPYDLLAKILQKLKRNDLIESYQGAHGGYKLKSIPQNITLAIILKALDEKIQITDCMVDDPTKEDCRRIESECCLRSPLLIIQNKIQDMFNELTIADISKNKQVNT